MLKEIAQKRGGVGTRAKVVTVDGANPAFLFPSAGSVQGAGGTFYRSDVMIVNHRPADQRISVGWIAQGVNNASRQLSYYTLKANTPYVILDFVGNGLLKQSGLGSVLVTGVTASGAVDPSAALDGFSRIWTPQPNAQGTVSLAFPSMDPLDLFGNKIGYSLGMRHDPAYRCNVGIVNLDTAAAHTWTVTINGDNPATPITNFNVTVDIVSMKQVPVPAGDYGNLLLAMEPNANTFWWSGYGASVDNITGDGWVSHAVQP
jgi:hypothetical protein